jgi:hypothetical protein
VIDGYRSSSSSNMSGGEPTLPAATVGGGRLTGGAAMVGDEPQ